MNDQNSKNSLTQTTIAFFLFTMALAIEQVLADSSATGVIDDTIRKMVTILNVLIVGIMVWSGFLLARGDSSAVQRIIYGIIGLVVVNSAEALLNFFK